MNGHVKVESHTTVVHKVDIDAASLRASIDAPSGITNEDEVVLVIHFPSARPATFRIAGYKFHDA